MLDRNVLSTVQKMVKQRIILPKDMMNPLQDMLGRIHKNLHIAATLLINEDENVARKLAEEKDVFRDIENRVSSIYYANLRRNSDNKKTLILYGSFMVELARDLKRTNTHVVASAAYPVLDQNGMLLPSRLQPEEDIEENDRGFDEPYEDNDVVRQLNDDSVLTRE